jgi:hypothetical protein
MTNRIAYLDRLTDGRYRVVVPSILFPGRWQAYCRPLPSRRAARDLAKREGHSVAKGAMPAGLPFITAADRDAYHAAGAARRAALAAKMGERA